MDSVIVGAQEKALPTGKHTWLDVGLGVTLTISGVTGYATIQIRDPGLPDPIVDCGEESIRVSFRRFVDRWKVEMRSSPSSSVRRMFASEHYQRIIGMGMPAVPLLLAELEASPDHWDWALEMITGENPVPPEAAGKLKEIAKAWVAWGRERRLV